MYSWLKISAKIKVDSTMSGENKHQLTAVTKPIADYSTIIGMQSAKIGVAFIEMKSAGKL